MSARSVFVNTVLDVTYCQPSNNKRSKCKVVYEKAITFAMFREVDIIIVYSACDENAVRAKIMYEAKYPD